MPTQARLQVIAVGLYSYLYMEPFVLNLGESTPALTLFKAVQTKDLLESAYAGDQSTVTEWWGRKSQCVGNLIGDPVQPVSVADPMLRIPIDMHLCSSITEHGHALTTPTG